MSETPMTKAELQQLARKLNGDIRLTDKVLSVNQLSDEETKLFVMLPTRLWNALEEEDLAAAVLIAEEIKHKAERFAYVVDNWGVRLQANYLFNEILFASESAG